MSWNPVASYGLWVLAFVLGAYVLARLLRQRRSPQSALAWLGFAALLPYLALPLFLLLGARKFRRAPRPVAPRVDGQANVSEEPIERVLRSYGVPAASSRNRLELHTTGEAIYGALVDLIAKAQESILITLFILHPDEVGRDILRRLTERAAQGIRVRLLLDGLGSFTTRRAHVAALRAAGGQVAIFHPLTRPSRWRRANLRNHRKIVLVDGRIALAGGINIARAYIGPGPRQDRWCDLAFVLEGPATQGYLELACSDWAYATGEPIDSRSIAPAGVDGGDAVVQVVGSGPDTADDPLCAAMLEAAFSARRRLWIATPYFIPDETLLSALAICARRGVDLRILIPKFSNHRVADWARGAYLREVERAGATVLLYEGAMLHAKALVVDDRLAFLGSANVDLRSLYLNAEAMIVAYSPGDIQAVAAWIDETSGKAEIGAGDVGMMRELFEGAVRLLAPIL